MLDAGTRRDIDRVYAHALVPEHLDRYRRTRAWNHAINSRQFGQGSINPSWPVDFRYPDITFERGVRDHLVGQPLGEGAEKKQ